MKEHLAVIFSGFLSVSVTSIEAAENVLPEATNQIAEAHSPSTPSDGDKYLCTLPSVSDEAKVVMYSTYEAAAIASVTVAGQDMETGVADVMIEEGDEPIYLILSTFDPMIWRFSGDVNRLEKVVATSVRPAPDNKAAVGLVGVKREKVFFAPPESCFELLEDTDGVRAEKAKETVLKAIGRAPDLLLVSQTSQSVTLPSNQTPSQPDYRVRAEAPAGFDKDAWHAFTRHYTQGVVNVAVNDVISDYQASEYEILPNGAGIAQLVGSGHLVSVRGNLVNKTYKIEKKIKRFPAEMTGGHASKFLLGKGVPMPEGDPGHSCVVSEESGEVLVKGVLCKR